MLYSPKLFYTVIFILLLAPVVTLLTAENSDSAVVLFAKKQAGVSSVISANVDSYCDLGNYAFLAIVVGLSEQEEALEITGSEADGFTLISRTPAIAGMILMIDEGIEFDRSLFDVKLKSLIVTSKFENIPRSVLITNLHKVSKGDLVVSVGIPMEYNLIVQCVGVNAEITNYYYYYYIEGGHLELSQIGSWRVQSIH